MNPKIIYIFDTSAFIKGMDVSVLQEYECYTTTGVLSEIKHKYSREKIDMAVLSGNLKVRSPDPEEIRTVKITSQISGDLPFLSTTDIEIIALSLSIHKWLLKDEIENSENFRIEVVTDDYSMQNVLSKLNLPTNSFLKKGIHHWIQWQIYCPICKTIYKTSENLICPKCEVRLKRRPLEVQ